MGIVCGEEETEPQGKTLSLPVSLYSNCHLQLWAEGNDWKGEMMWHCGRSQTHRVDFISHLARECVECAPRRRKVLVGMSGTLIALLPPQPIPDKRKITEVKYMNLKLNLLLNITLYYSTSWSQAAGCFQLLILGNSNGCIVIMSACACPSCIYPA